MKFVQNFLLSHRANRRAKRAAAKKHIPKKLLNGFLKDFQNFNSRAINKNLTPALEKDIYPYLFEKTAFSNFKLKEFTLISTKDELKLIRNDNPDLVKKETWGCGCFHFIK